MNRLPLLLLAALVPTGLGLAQPAAAPAVTMRHVVLHRDDTMFYLGPTLAQLPDGDILLSVREAHIRQPAHQSHCDPSARGILLRSHDGGRTFGEKQIVYDETYKFSSAEDTVVAVLPDGSLFATVYSWEMAPLPYGFDMAKLHTGRNLLQQAVYGGQKINFPYVAVFEGLWGMRSTDGGKNWTERKAIDLPNLAPLVCRAPVLQTKDGSLVTAVQEMSIDQAFHKVYCIRSTDRGETWGQPVLVADGNAQRLHFWEPGLGQLKSGRLIVMSRTDGSDNAAAGLLYESISDDGGRSWRPVVKTPMWGYPASILELRDGRVLCMYGHRRAPFGIRACLSYDGGVTWDIAHEIILRNDGGSSDLGYPGAIQLADGQVLMAYYFNQEKPGDLASRTRFIAGTYLDFGR